MNELADLKAAADALEAQRAALGDGVVDAGLRPLLARIAALEAATGGERKLVTALFADLVGFTTMSERMDPEDVRDVLNTYFARWSASIEDHGGEVEKFVGDAVMAVFGMRKAREDDPERAILTALDMVSSLADLNEELARSSGPRLAMRVGINTGEVVIGAVGERQSDEFVVVGDPINVAARLQAAAPVNGILIAHATFRHVRGLFDVQEIPAIELKGKQEPTLAYVVLRAKPRAFHAEARGVEGVETRMVGRNAEISRLRDAYRSVVEDSSPAMVTIVGDAGIGKSRLLEEFEGWLDLLPDQVFYMRGRAHQGMGRDALSLMREVVAFRFGILDTDPPALVEAKLAAGFGDTDPELVGMGMPGQRSILAGHLLGFHLPPQSIPADIEPQAMREMAEVAIVDWIREAATSVPVVMVLDDIHWADDSSLDLVSRLLTDRGGASILVVCGARPSLYVQRPGWQAGERRHQRLVLEPLTNRDSRDLVADILQKVRDVPEDFRETVVAAAEGNPYHVEELLKMLIEDGAIIKHGDVWEVVNARLPTLSVPSTLVGVLQARIDALALAHKSVLYRAAVVGRTFWDRAVAAIGDSNHPGEGTVESSLSLLRDRELIYRKESSSFADATEHTFKHAVLRDVAYQSVLRKQRKEYHIRAAEWLRSVVEANDRADEFAAVIAGHYDSGDQVDEASVWYLRAGEAAAARFANIEAMSLLDRALSLIPSGAPEILYRVIAARQAIHNTTGDRQAEAQDIDELTALAEVLGDHRKRADIELMRAALASDVGRLADAEAHARVAADLARAAGDTSREARALLAIGGAEWKRGNPAAAIPVLTAALETATAGHHELVAAGSLHSRGVAYHNMGAYDLAEDDYRAAYQIWHDKSDRGGTSRVLNSLGILAYDREDFTVARSYLDKALKSKRALGERLGENRVLNNLALVATAQHDYETVIGAFNRTLALAVEIDDLEGEAASHQGLGYAALRLGQLDQAEHHLGKSRELYSEEGDQQGEVQVIELLAQLARARGSQLVAQDLAKEAADTASKAGLAIELAASLALLARLQLETGAFDDAAKAFQQVLELHADLGSPARLVQVRAGLAEALQALNRPQQARRLVEEVLEHFRTRGSAGVDQPVEVLLACNRVLEAQRDAAAHEPIEMAHHHLAESAGRISDGELRRSYLENVAAHRMLHQ